MTKFGDVSNILVGDVAFCIAELADWCDDIPSDSMTSKNGPPKLTRVTRSQQKADVPVEDIKGRIIDLGELGRWFLGVLERLAEMRLYSATIVCTARCSVVSIGRFRASGPVSACSFGWTPVRYRNVIGILKNPFYAGVYVYGKSENRTAIVDGRARRSYGHGKPTGSREVMISAPGERSCS